MLDAPLVLNFLDIFLMKERFQVLGLLDVDHQAGQQDLPPKFQWSLPLVISEESNVWDFCALLNGT